MSNRKATLAPDGQDSQHYDFAQIQHTLKMRYRKTLHVIMGQAKLSKESAEVTIPVCELVKAFGKGGDSGQEYEKFRMDTFTQGLLQELVHVPSPNGGWMKAQWVSMCEYNAEADTLRVRLNSALIPYILEYRERYMPVTLEQISRFAGVYAWEYYELFTLASNMARGSVKPSEFIIAKTVQELRDLLHIKPDYYKLISRFRVDVVENPIAELNRLNCGIHIVPHPIKKGTRLVGFRFLCRLSNAKDTKPMADPAHDQEEN